MASSHIAGIRTTISSSRTVSLCSVDRHCQVLGES